MSSFVCTELNGFKYFYLTVIILSNINDLFVLSEVVSSAVRINSLICMQLNCFKFCNLTLMIIILYYIIYYYNSIQHNLFFCTPSIGFKYCYVIQKKFTFYAE